MVRIVVEAMERSLPNDVQYRSERITSFRAEIDSVEPLTPEVLAAIRGKQLADLDAQEAVLRKRWKMREPTPSDLAMPGGDFQAADKPLPSAPVVRVGAIGQPSTPRGNDAAPRQPESKAPPHVTPDGKPFPPGLTLAAGVRQCTDPEHPANKPLFITSNDWDTSHRFFGRALCQAHMAKARTGRPS